MKTRKDRLRTVGDLVAYYKVTPEFTALAAGTRKDYLRYLDLISAEFGTMPLAAVPAARGDFKEWRDGLSATPRKADLAWTVLARVFAVGKDRGKIPVNPCERGGRLYAPDRMDKVWSDDHLERLFAHASPEVRAVVMVALWTGLRQEDVLRLPWSAYDGTTIQIRASKRTKKSKPRPAISVKVGEPLRRVLDALPRLAPTMLLSSLRRPWTPEGFRSSLRKVMKAADLANADLHFHDLRGTAVTRLAMAGATVPEIAAVTGHALQSVHDILSRHYLARNETMATNAISKREAFEERLGNGKL